MSDQPTTPPPPASYEPASEPAISPEIRHAISQDPVLNTLSRAVQQQCLGDARGTYNEQQLLVQNHAISELIQLAESQHGNNLTNAALDVGTTSCMNTLAGHNGTSRSR
ncbi:MAG: hypothetical protein CMM94_07360 [Rickettsiales bacterium]|nr:hypothetical protein [Rickettsiales bacterium]